MHVPLDERVARWLAQADSDEDVARLVRDRQPHIACFHAQQSAEKAVKALLTRLTGDALPTPDLSRLLAACEHAGCGAPVEALDDARSLDKYYVPTRYPDALGFSDAALSYGPRDVDAASAAARTVRDWCETAIAELRGADGDPP